MKQKKILKEYSVHIINDPQYSLFFSHHYRTKIEQSFRPIWTSTSMYFPANKITYRKNLTFFDKIKYYITDMKLYLKERKNHMGI